MTRLRFESFALALLLAQTAFSHTIRVGRVGRFTTIRSALAIAKAGDTVVVSQGIYREQLKINKPLTLIGVGQPVINGQQRGTNITIAADNVTIRGFRIINSARS